MRCAVYAEKSVTRRPPVFVISSTASMADGGSRSAVIITMHRVSTCFFFFLSIVSCIRVEKPTNNSSNVSDVADPALANAQYGSTRDMASFLAERVSCNSLQYRCRNGRQCIDRSHLCDGVDDCSDRSDEGDRCNECRFENGGCQHECRNNPNGAECWCRDGWRLAHDGVTCEDHDECAHGRGYCHHFCHNTIGGYTCSCAPGFVLQNDGSTCKLEQYDSGQILFSVGHQVRNLALNTWHHLDPDENPDVGIMCDVRVGTVEGLDTNNVNGHYYYTRNGGVYAHLNAEVCIAEGLFETGANVAVDWVTGNVYFVNENPPFIGLCRLDGRFCTILDQTDSADVPRGLALAPKSGLMFWTDWGKNARIERANMDGSGRRVVVQDRLIWPNAIAVDYVHNLLYFADSEYNLIERCRFDGSHREVVVKSGVFHPFDMVVFDDHVFWTEWGVYGVMVANVSNNSTRPRALYYNEHEQPFGIAMLHPAYQEKGLPNPCLNKNCSHICALAVDERHGHEFVKASCLCPTNYQFRSENKSECVPVEHPTQKSVHWCDEAFEEACNEDKACEHGGRCKVDADEHGTVKRRCECRPGYVGTYCEVSKSGQRVNELDEQGGSGWLAATLVFLTFTLLTCGLVALLCRYGSYRQKIHVLRWSPSVIFRKTIAATRRHGDVEQRQRMISTTEDGSKGGLGKVASFANPVYEEVQVPVHQAYTIFKQDDSTPSPNSDADSGFEFNVPNGSP